jgi:hypothetical protein
VRRFRHELRYSVGTTQKQLFHYFTKRDERTSPCYIVPGRTQQKTPSLTNTSVVGHWLVFAETCLPNRSIAMAVHVTSRFLQFLYCCVLGYCGDYLATAISLDSQFLLWANMPQYSHFSVFVSSYYTTLHVSAYNWPSSGVLTFWIKGTCCSLVELFCFSFWCKMILKYFFKFF